MLKWMLSEFSQTRAAMRGYNRPRELPSIQMYTNIRSFPGPTPRGITANPNAFYQQTPPIGGFYPQGQLMNGQGGMFQTGSFYPQMSGMDLGQFPPQMNAMGQPFYSQMNAMGQPVYPQMNAMGYPQMNAMGYPQMNAMGYPQMNVMRQQFYPHINGMGMETEQFGQRDRVSL
jgi:hypothetical protein